MIRKYSLLVIHGVATGRTDRTDQTDPTHERTPVDDDGARRYIVPDTSA